MNIAAATSNQRAERRGGEAGDAPTVMPGLDTGSTGNRFTVLHDPNCTGRCDPAIRITDLDGFVSSLIGRHVCGGTKNGDAGYLGAAAATSHMTCGRNSTRTSTTFVWAKIPPLSPLIGLCG